MIRIYDIPNDTFESDEEAESSSEEEESSEEEGSEEEGEEHEEKTEAKNKGSVIHIASSVTAEFRTILETFVMCITCKTTERFYCDVPGRWGLL